jgi:uncharacterized membrane protein YccC
MIRWPGISDWLFSLKTFAAAMLAVYIAFSIGLDRPYWAMAAVYIVSQPLTGALRSKAMYRLVGTVIGATATVVLVPNLVDAPELLSGALALWTGGCLYVALLDRTPRSYLCVAAGFTAAIIGFPAVTTPDQIWDIALARTEETGLGIICSTVIGSVVFPRALGPILSNRILAWAGNASLWAEDLLAGREDTAAASAAHIRLAADAVELRMLASQLSYDTSVWQTATRWVRALQQRMVLLLPLLSSIADRLAALRAANGITPGLQHLLTELQGFVRAGNPPPRSEADRMRALIARCEAETDPRVGWNDVMRSSLLRRLAELVDLRQDMRDLRRHIGAGGGALPMPLARQVPEHQLLHHDRGLALLSGLAATLTVLLVCAFWIGTGWQAGGSAAGLSAAACCLFAALDDPTPALKLFLAVTLVGVLAVGIFQFGILPQVHDFEILALVLAAFFVPVGLLMTNPTTQPAATALGFLTATLLSLESTYSADFVSYADGSFASILGVGSAIVVTAVMRSVGAEWSARRLLRAAWRDFASIPGRERPHERTALAGLLVDRIGLMVPRLAAVGAGNELTAVDALADLRIGLNMADVQRNRDAMPLPVRQAVDDVLLGAAAHYAAQAEAGRVLASPSALLDTIDRALDTAIAMPEPHDRDLLLQLVGIRRGLFAAAAPYQPQPPPDDVASVDAPVRAAA